MQGIYTYGRQSGVEAAAECGPYLLPEAASCSRTPQGIFRQPGACEGRAAHEYGQVNIARSASVSLALRRLYIADEQTGISQLHENSLKILSL